MSLCPHSAKYQKTVRVSFGLLWHLVGKQFTAAVPMAVGHTAMWYKEPGTYHHWCAQRPSYLSSLAQKSETGTFPWWRAEYQLYVSHFLRTKMSSRENNNTYIIFICMLQWWLTQLYHYDSVCFKLCISKKKRGYFPPHLKSHSNTEHWIQTTLFVLWTFSHIPSLHIFFFLETDCNHLMP